MLGKKTDQVAVNALQSHLGITDGYEDMDRSNRLGKVDGPIIKNLIYNIKRKLKGIVIMESLTSKRMLFMKQPGRLKKEGKVLACWSDVTKKWKIVHETISHKKFKKRYIISTIADENHCQISD